MLYFNITHFILLIFTLCSAQHIYADENSRKNSSNQDKVSEGTRSPSQPTQELEASSPIKPTIILIVAVLAVLLFIILLLLLYAKNCKLGAGHSNLTIGGVVTPQVDRKSSGIERVVVESLPLFRFRSLRGQKDGLECAVCLNRFEATEILRLLPKCKHAFHVECVDTWLDAHSTCPLCRYRVDKKDILLIEDNNNNNKNNRQKQEQQESSQDVVLSFDPNPVVVDQCQRRHLSVGEAELGNRIMSKSNRWRTDQSLSLDDSGNNNKKKKNGSWLTSSSSLSSSSSRRRVEHRILVSDCDWQQKQECDLVLVRQDMLLTTRDTRLVDKEVSQRSLTMNINKRSLSELTSLSRFPSIRVASGISSSKSTNCSSCNQNFNIVSQN